MRRALAYAGHRAVATWAYTIGLFLALSVLFPLVGWLVNVVGPKVEAAVFPPTTGPDERVEQIRNMDGSIAARFTATRLRECDRIESQWYVVAEGRRVQVVDGVKVVGSLPARRPGGVNVSPVNVFPASGTYLLRVEYDCGLPWRSVVDIGPLEIGGAE